MPSTLSSGHTRRYALLICLILLAAILMARLRVWPYPAHAASIQTTASNDAPIVGLTQVLYDGALGGTPDTQGFFYLPVGQASTTWAGGITTLNTFTDTTTQAGYANAIPPLLPVPLSFPILDRATGYTLRFSAQVISEDHPLASSDRNGDGLGDRAGFNVIAISSDGQQGIELGFWTDQIWAQNGGAAEPPPNSNTLFTHGESASFNTTAGLIPYELRVLGSAYSLTVGSTEILSGSLRDYTAFNGSPDVYETPNFIFFGDNTGSAKAIVKLSHISVITNAALPNRTAAGNIPLVIDNLGLMDIDAGGQNVVMTLTANNGILTLTTTAPGGLTGGQISGNGSPTVMATGPLGQINTSLAFTPALIYSRNTGFFGIDTVTVTINDQGYSGSGGALTAQKTFNITVKTSNSGYLPVIVKKY
ncbi:MAG: hypothetical protein BroJett011_20440 [Chloroflexota bacterium]|nr:MAG: hypothetical protein BroJett011_20440 [Chloroflexota bacterium]